jgi:Transposase DDE domain
MHVGRRVVAGRVRGSPSRQKGALLLERAVTRGTSCIRRLGDGEGTQTKGFRRFLANAKVTLARLIESWSEQTAGMARGRHVLAIQDTSELQFNTTGQRTRGLGEVGKGKGRRGALLHAMMAVDAQDGACLGLVGGTIWTRAGRVEIAHGERALADKESRRWLDTARTARTVLEQAECITVVADRESDIYAEWATLPDHKLHLLTRVMHDRSLADGGTLYQAADGFSCAGKRTIELKATPKRAARTATLSVRFGTVQLKRPPRPGLKGLPDSVQLTLVEAVELEPPAGAEPVHWRLLTTHQVVEASAAWQIVDWYRMRWTIEQFFRVLKTQGFRIEDSQLDSAEVLLKLIAVAAKAAAITIQLLQARDGHSTLSAAAAFDSTHIDALAAVNARYEARSPRQRNPHAFATMAWAAWIIARLGGWDGYKSSRPPGPITLKHGLDHFFAIAVGWALRDVSTP